MIRASNPLSASSLKARAAIARLRHPIESGVAFFYSSVIASRSPNTVCSTRANVSRWMAHASVSALGSVTVLKMAQRAWYSARTSAPVCLTTAASMCMSAMFCACRLLSLSMSSFVSMCCTVALVSTARNHHS